MKRLFTAMGITLILLAIPATIVLSATNAVWNKYTGNPIMFYGKPAGWDDFSIYSTEVMFWDHNDADPSNDEFYMWYSGTSYNLNEKNIGFASSKDGMTWTKYDGNPVLVVSAFGEWDHDRVNAPSVLYDADDNTWKMWYAGVSIYNGGYAIGYATSPDGKNWTKYGDRWVFDSSGYADSFDGYSVLSPEVIKKGGKFHMWYAGNGGISSNQIGYATSDDGIHWDRVSDDPVLRVGPEGAWDEGETVSPAIIVDKQGTIHMWYQGSDGNKSYTGIGHATSTNGVDWQKDGANPLMVGESLGVWDAERVFYPTVAEDADGNRYLWYHARRENMDTLPFKLGLAFYDFTKQPTPTPTPLPGITPTATPTDPVIPADGDTCRQGSNSCLFLPSVKR